MARALGVGGVFFKSPDPERLLSWYAEHLGFERGAEPGIRLRPTDLPEGSYLMWGPFSQDTAYFSPSTKPFMLNLIVDDLAGALKQVAAGGAEVVGDVEHYDYGSFGWFVDPDGNKVELWQPKAAAES